MTHRIILVLLISLCIQSCIDRNASVPVFNLPCDNAFVLSDMESIFLYEIKDAVITEKVREFSNRSNRGAVYDCKRNILISPYGYKGRNKNKGGLTIFNMLDGSQRDYEIKDGVAGQLGFYKEGILLATMLIHAGPVNPEGGFVPPKSIIDKETVLSDASSYPPEVVNEYKNGGQWKTFEYTHLFNLDKKEIERSFSQGLYYGAIIGKKRISELVSAATGVIDLETGHIDELITWKKFINGDQLELNIPDQSIGLVVQDKYYYITTMRSWDTASARDIMEMKRFKRNAIYLVSNKKINEQFATIPIKNIGYVVSVENNIYIFDQKAKKVFRFDTETGVTQEYHISNPSLVVNNKYVVDAVGYTKDNFIIAMSSGKEGKGIMFITSKDFSRIGKINNVPMVNMGITTNQNTQTLFNRSFQ